ncbi:hypothetical protein [Nesterenkonia flava]|uniref:Uncharacterized protein n=1 Tax=Nesterenkonia flava TaxID=469799 RepID=A0ABU1FW76_9MICC|nr:hypothetical protein [Nesterenkonia flava]MDR5712939.1 hypothetical protein [Nesterenkonia flava]
MTSTIAPTDHEVQHERIITSTVKRNTGRRSMTSAKLADRIVQELSAEGYAVHEDRVRDAVDYSTEGGYFTNQGVIDAVMEAEVVM